MRILLDTHTLIWWITDDPKISKHAKESIENGNNEILLSAASIWQIVIKAQLGRLELPLAPEEFLLKQIRQNDFSQLPITINHTLQVLKLPSIHKDPFNRILIAQAKSENIPIITSDSIFKKYKINNLVVYI